MSFADDFKFNTDAILGAAQPAAVASPFQVLDVTNLGLGKTVDFPAEGMIPGNTTLATGQAAIADAGSAISATAADLPSGGATTAAASGATTAAASGATTAAASGAQSGIGAVISNYFSRTIIIILGFIFVGAGLSMFKKG